MSHSSMTYSQKKRSKLDYRSVYFKRNPGLFGCVWFCAYCHRPLVGKHSVVVDHIMPLNNPLGRNKGYNLVASCQTCNSRKSDKVDFRVAEGYAVKVLQSIIFTVQKIVILFFVALYACCQRIIAFVCSMITSPFRKGSAKTIAVAVIVYALFVYFLFKSIY